MFTTDAFLVSNFFNILYLTKFETLSPNEREAYVLLIGKRKIIITDARYDSESHNEDSELYILRPGERVGEAINRICKENNIKTLGVEADDLKWSEMQMIQKLSLDVIPLSQVFSLQRSIKSEEELFAIKQACHIGDSVLRDITPYLHPGQTEKEIAWLIERSIREGYNAELSFDPIVAADEHAAAAHYNTKTGSGVVKENSLLLIDFGVKVHNYCSDITRMVGFGEVDKEVVSSYDVLLKAQLSAIEFAAKATNLSEVDAHCRQELQKQNLPTYSHSTGHGIGLEVHEAPRLSAISEDKKAAGQVFTIEPGIYHSGKWGMRIEDTVSVSSTGEIEVLTRFPKSLVRL